MSHQQQAEETVRAASILAEKMADHTRIESPELYAAALGIVQAGGFLEVAVQLDTDQPRVRLNVIEATGNKRTLCSVSLTRVLSH